MRSFKLSDIRDKFNETCLSIYFIWNMFCSSFTFCSLDCLKCIWSIFQMKKKKSNRKKSNKETIKSRLVWCKIWGNFTCLVIAHKSFLIHARDWMCIYKIWLFVKIGVKLLKIQRYMTLQTIFYIKIYPLKAYVLKKYEILK